MFIIFFSLTICNLSICILGAYCVGKYALILVLNIGLSLCVLIFQELCKCCIMYVAAILYFMSIDMYVNTEGTI